ncbi:hypothetical protein F471_03756 [Pseudomonas sp. URMO17WK12:I1]|uniref:hypothetical protein n=1 Tax=unclassified Pseudomonas TaxID=196821 RepID=UPI0004854D39|nr:MULTISPECIES: hypothetical protein [unclassified Pseudomonas]PZW65278.1 hypothetical protein F471_03756 [Pseudomonas sp. URMO17WK12:I1]
MLNIYSSKWGVVLDKQLGTQQGVSIWEFHRAASSVCRAQGRRTYRYARIKPAEPKDGQEVEVTLMLTPTSPESDWLALGVATARTIDSI